MRLTSEVILGSENYLNAYNDREINFRGKKIPAIENLAILQDAYDVIDFSDNDIKKIDNFPTMNRLNTLLFHNNNISRIHPQIGKYLPNLKNMILNNNKIQHYYEIEHLSSFQQLTILSLLENPITYRQYYREYTIYKLNSLKVLDFQKISNKERKSIQSFFETNQSGKQFLMQVENEKNFYYQQLQQKSQQISSVLSSSAAAVSNNGNHSNGTSNVPPLPTPPPPASKPGQLVLTEDQKLQVKQAIERATTKEEIDLIEHQLKTGTFVFKATASQLENSDSNSQRDDGKSGTKAASKALSSQDYADMDVID